MADYVKCRECGKGFSFYPSHKRKYCSLACSASATRMAPVRHTCEVCGCEFKRSTPSRPQRFCNTKCGAIGRSGPYRTKAHGSTSSYRGYVMVHLNGRRRAVPEHVLKVEKVLGRRLRKGELVHHVNGDKADNRNANLLVCRRPYHSWIHARMSYLYQREAFSRG